MLLRQVQARPLQGHHLRALRRRGDPAEGAPRAHGPHRPGRARFPHLVLQGRAVAHRLPARHRAARAGEGALLRRLDRHRRRQGREAEGPRRPRGQGARRVRRGRRRPRGAARRSRAAPLATAELPDQGNRPQLRRGRRVLGPWPRQLGGGADAADARGRARARGRPLQGDRTQGHDRGREEDPRARADDRHPRRPAPAAAGARERRADGDRDPGRARAAAQGAEEGDRVEEGCRHEAHQPRARRPARRRRPQRGRRRARGAP